MKKMKNLELFQRSLKKQIKWDKKHPVLAWIRIRFYRLPDLPKAIKLSIRSAIQRIRRGWADRDTWALDYYLAETIENSVYHLKKHAHGHPGDLTEGQWVDILNIISEAFYLAKRISDGELLLIRNLKYRKEMQEVLDNINKRCGNNDRCLTDKEIKIYDQGWKLFKKYFFNLWD